ncbi:CDP-glycerol glycerophosphotransferase family protein [Apilactobacillus xinyiensis]|uniref:CDP-glycerol glycerophosphotransferase family protein n=1 Tax=Apilactobacillus xinyiensis TaxID=2841032 RepID=UPI0024B1D90F|nr:CDP-glycerol glycerophosphotransferase family protein [Apilactobacillus xinyiensis]
MVGYKLKVFYLWLIKIISFLCNFRKKRNVIYIMSFDNNLQLIKKIANNLPKNRKLIVLYKPVTEAAATDLAAYGIETVPFWDGLHFVFKILPTIMTGSLIFCDNYFPFLGGMYHSHKTKIIQLWHANGAIKKFGWEDPTTSLRSKSDKKRFQKVYDSFDDYVVASETMGKVFENSYHVPFERMKMIGYPRSDRLFHHKWQDLAKKRVYKAAPELKNKRVILYAPTYREDIGFNPPKDLSKVLSSTEDAVVVVKLHPLLKDREHELQQISNNQNLCFYSQLSTNDLLSVTDTLITDYSSIAFDFALLPKAHSLLFFMFDLDKYKKDPGIQDDMLNWLPSKPITTTGDLAKAIKSNHKTDFTKFNQNWNTYNDGFATERLIDKYIKTLK